MRLFTFLIAMVVASSVFGQAHNSEQKAIAIQQNQAADNQLINRQQNERNALEQQTHAHQHPTGRQPAETQHDYIDRITGSHPCPSCDSFKQQNQAMEKKHMNEIHAQEKENNTRLGSARNPNAH